MFVCQKSWFTRSINNRTTIGKIKEFLGWNRDEYPVTVTAPLDESPLRPPRRKRPSRNSVAPSESSVVKVIPPATPMHVNDIESVYGEKQKDETNHIWRDNTVLLTWNTHENYPAPYYNIPFAIPYLEWQETLRERTKQRTIRHSLHR